MRDLIKLIETSLDNGSIARVIKAARAFGFNGFGGACGEAAIAINHVMFAGQGEIVGVFNRAFLEHDHAIGHIAVSYNGTIWDADGLPKTLDDIEHWGSLDPEDSDYRELADDYGVAWNDDTASDVEIVAFDSDEEVLQHCVTGHLEEFEMALRKAMT